MKICTNCNQEIDWDLSRERILEEEPDDVFAKPMEAFTEHAQALRLGLLCVSCYEKEP